MEEREIDRLLGELFKRSIPLANGDIVQAEVDRKLPRLRRASRRRRSARAVAIVFASIVLVGGAAYGGYELVGLLGDEPVLVITDPTLPAVDMTAVGSEPAGETSMLAAGLAELVPVAGTAVLEQVRSEGVTTIRDDAASTVRVTGEVRVFSLRMLQPVLSGTLEITADLSMRKNGSADLQGSWVLTNELGTWKCDGWTGDRSADGTEEFGVGNGVGSGASEGLTLHLQWYPDPGAPNSMSVTGWVRSAE